MMSYAGSGWLPRNCGTCIYIVFEARKEPNEPLQPSILQVRPALAVKPRSLFSNAIRGRASTSAYADSRLWYRAHVGGLRVSRPGRSAYPNGNPRTASDVYTRRGLLLAAGEKCRTRASGKSGEIIISGFNDDYDSSHESKMWRYKFNLPMIKLFTISYLNIEYEKEAKEIVTQIIL